MTKSKVTSMIREMAITEVMKGDENLRAKLAEYLYEESEGINNGAESAYLGAMKAASSAIVAKMNEITSEIMTAAIEKGAV